MKMPTRQRWVLPVFCYAAALLLYFSAAVFTLAEDTVRIREGEMVPQELHVEDFTLKGFEARKGRTDDTLYVSTSEDPQLHYTPKQPFYANRFTFHAKPLNQPTSEIVLYFSTGLPGQYNERDKLWAKQSPDGSWYFDLGGRKISSLRLDPDPQGGVLWQVQRIALNDPKPASDYFFPSPVAWFILLFFPALAAASIREASSIFKMYQLRRKDSP